MRLLYHIGCRARKSHPKHADSPAAYAAAGLRLSKKWLRHFFEKDQNLFRRLRAPELLAGGPFHGLPIPFSQNGSFLRWNQRPAPRRIISATTFNSIHPQ